jgi:hypothetical protein
MKIYVSALILKLKRMVIDSPFHNFKVLRSSILNQPKLMKMSAPVLTQKKKSTWKQIYILIKKTTNNENKKRKRNLDCIKDNRRTMRKEKEKQINEQRSDK